MMKSSTSLLLILLTFLFPLGSSAKEVSPAKVSQAGPPTSIDALYAYPQDIRKAALEVSLHHNLLIEVKGIQAQAVNELKALLKGKPRPFQDQVYQLIRFPKLLMELVAGGPKSVKQINVILSTYPREIHKIARNLTRNNYDLLKKIDQINQKSDQQFQALIKDYPPETKKAYLKVLQHPVVLEILTKNLGYSYLLGEAYQSGEKSAQGRLAAVGQAARKKDRIASATRKRELALDPAAEKLQKAADEFTAKANTPLDKVLDPKKAVQVNITYDPYFNSYWNAAPSFYDYPYWYGFPDWGYWGW